MRVPLKTVLRDEREYLFHLAAIMDVFGKHVFIEWTASTAVDEQIIPNLLGTR